MRVPQLVVSDQKSTGAVELEKLDSQTRVACACPASLPITCAATTRI
jgi:hypothetical protein